MLNSLLERRARADAANLSGECPVHWATKSSNVTALDAMTRGNRGLLSTRDCDGFTPFIISAQTDNAPVMEWMYLKGISIEEQDDYGRTALQWACYKGNRRTVQWLLSRSASIVHRDHEEGAVIAGRVTRGAPSCLPRASTHCFHPCLGFYNFLSEIQHLFFLAMCSFFAASVHPTSPTSISGRGHGLCSDFWERPGHDGHSLGSAEGLRAGL
eukprot:g22325.t1